MRVSEREKGREDMRLRDSRIREFLKNTKENELENCEEGKCTTYLLQLEFDLGHPCSNLYH